MRRGKRKKLDKSEVYAALRDKRWHKQKELAKSFGVSPRTVRARIKELHVDNVGVIFGPGGYRLREPSDIGGERTAREIERHARMVVGVFVRAVIMGKPLRPLLAKAIRLLPAEQRQPMRKLMASMQVAVAQAEAEAETD